MQKLDSMERISSAASKDAQTYEAQLQGMHRQLKEAQAAARVFEQDSEKVRSPVEDIVSKPQRIHNPVCQPGSVGASDKHSRVVFGSHKHQTTRSGRPRHSAACVSKYVMSSLANHGVEQLPVELPYPCSVVLKWTALILAWFCRVETFVIIPVSMYM